jgi:hypothetical protein
MFGSGAVPPPGAGEEAERRLAGLNIARIVAYPRSETGVDLASASPWYKSLPERWRVVAQPAGTLYMLAPKER